jgi:hypothetical protein
MTDNYAPPEARPYGTGGANGKQAWQMAYVNLRATVMLNREQGQRNIRPRRI